MYTTEEKVNLIMRYISTEDFGERSELKRRIADIIGTDRAPVRKPVDVSDVIRDMLNDLGMPHGIIGYEYAVTAIELVYNNREYIRAVTARLYPDVAAMHGTTYTRVERAVRHSIELTMDNGSYAEVARVFGNTIYPNKGKPTNRQFIATCADEVRRRMKTMGI